MGCLIWVLVGVLLFVVIVEFVCLCGLAVICLFDVVLEAV